MNRKSSVRFGCIIWLFAIHMNAATTLSHNTTNTISNTENLYSSKLGVQHVLSRKKRYLLFPPGSAFVATMSFAKAIASDYPRGVNLVTEVDFYYPMYSTIAELFPKKKTTTPIPTRKPIPIEFEPMKLSDSLMANPKFDQYPGTYYDNDNAWKRKWNKLTYPQSYRSTPLQYRHDQYIPINSNYLNWKASKPWYKPPLKYFSKPTYYNQHSNDFPYSSNKYRDWNWRQHESYRSRRDLYNHIEGMAEQHGFEIKSCIHRMICEGRHYLLPPGVSFLQDVLRILFTIPVSNDIDDGYSKAMQSTENECISDYGEKCPYSIIGYLIHNQQEQNK